MSRPRRKLGMLLAVLVVLAGCGPTQGTGQSGAPPDEGASELCPAIRLSGQSGESVRLTGRWLATDFGSYAMTQRQSCLHWLGMSPAVDEWDAGSWWTNVYVGQIDSDFTIRGEWADVPYQPDYEGSVLSSGELILDLTFFVDDAGREWPTLHLVDIDYGGGYGGEYWVPEEALPPMETFTGTYGYSDCPWLEVGGTRYELAEWQFSTTQQGELLGDDLQTIAQPGDELMVEGQIWPAPTPTTCVPDLLMAWNIEVLP